jgi:hypothetical protein
MSLSPLPPSPAEDEEADIEWVVQSLIAFGLAKSTAQRLIGLSHVTPDMVARWLTYCRLRGSNSPHNTNAFLITRLYQNDVPAPSWGALRRLAARLGKPAPTNRRW